MSHKDETKSANYKLNALFEACDDGTENGIRDAAMFALMAEHQLRVQEVSALSLLDLCLARQTIKYKPVKKQPHTPEITMLGRYKQDNENAGYTTVSLSERAFECLARWLEIHNGVHALFYGKSGLSDEYVALKTKGIIASLKKRIAKAKLDMSVYDFYYLASTSQS